MSFIYQPHSTEITSVGIPTYDHGNQRRVYRYWPLDRRQQPIPVGHLWLFKKQHADQWDLFCDCTPLPGTRGMPTRIWTVKQATSQFFGLTFIGCGRTRSKYRCAFKACLNDIYQSVLALGPFPNPNYPPPPPMPPSPPAIAPSHPETNPSSSPPPSSSLPSTDNNGASISNGEPAFSEMPNPQEIFDDIWAAFQEYNENPVHQELVQPGAENEQALPNAQKALYELLVPGVPIISTLRLSYFHSYNNSLVLAMVALSRPSSSSSSSSSSIKYDTIIFDLGDVLFTWSPSTKTSVSPKTLRSILQTTTWFQYEKGEISEEECYASVALEMTLSPSEVRDAFQHARESLVSRPFMVDLIRELRPGRKIYAMSNISAEDFDFLRGRSLDIDLFDHCFTSSAAGERKPNIGYFRHVLERTGADPARTIFASSTMTSKMSSVNFVTFVSDPTARGEAFLRQHACKHLSYTSTGITIHENFAQLLILEATHDPTLVNYVKYDGPFNFFKGEGELTTSAFPCDVDTTSIGITCSDHMSLERKHEVMDAILELPNADGIPQVYFDAFRPRIDPVVCVNVLTLFYKQQDVDSSLHTTTPYRIVLRS
ncbi:Haloacid dehalogenase-like hydrolase-domain-containing protein [Lentinula raphanica]|nr:Haloacid dehalogenase-like hydrolase-domain-containing protein [Lentinula raphanica]